MTNDPSVSSISNGSASGVDQKASAGPLSLAEKRGAESSMKLEVGQQQSLSRFETYEDYLDSQVNDLDLYFLEDQDIARQLVELGFRGNGKVLSRDEFDARKKAEAERDKPRKDEPKPLASAGCDLMGSIFLQALASREDLVRSGKLSTIIFIRDKNKKGQEVSGYIDFGQRLISDAFEPIFQGKKRLMPRPSDLSYYNWDSLTSTSNSTSNFQVLVDPEQGLLFKNKRDRKIVNVDPKDDPGDNTTRTELATTEYIHLVIYDHMTRRKA